MLGAGVIRAFVAGELMIQAVIDALEHESGEFFVEAEGLGDVVADAGVSGGSRRDDAWDVGGGMASGGEKIGMYDDEGGALGDAAVEGLVDGGGAEFHVGGLDDGRAGDALEHGGDVEKHVVGGATGGAVIDHDEADGMAGITEHETNPEG